MASKPTPLSPLREFHKALINSFPNSQGTASCPLIAIHAPVSSQWRRKRVWKTEQISICSYPCRPFIACRIGLASQYRIHRSFHDILSSSFVLAVVSFIPPAPDFRPCDCNTLIHRVSEVCFAKTSSLFELCATWICPKLWLIQHRGPVGIWFWWINKSGMNVFHLITLRGEMLERQGQAGRLD